MPIILPVDQMQEADQRAIRAGTSGIVLMARAGVHVGQHAAEMLAGCDPTVAPVLVLCGPGKNGGDGFVAARWLQEHRFPVRVAFLGVPEALVGETAHHASLWRGPTVPLTLDGVRFSRTEAPSSDGWALVIDALFGIGLTRPLGTHVQTVLDSLSDHRVLAVDLPSGVRGDDGQLEGRPLQAERTVTFVRHKPGHIFPPGRELCGSIRLVDIGIEARHLEALPDVVYVNQPPVVRLPAWDDHKYRRGIASFVLGRYPGASLLAARACANAGCGLVRLYGTPDQAVLAHLGAPFATFETLETLWKTDARASLSSSPPSVYREALVLGSGWDAAPFLPEMVARLLRTNRTCILDGGVFHAFSGRWAELAELCAAAARPVILTPHAGEFARLTGETQKGDLLALARLWSGKLKAILVLKGAVPIIAHPGGRLIVQLEAPPRLAQGGSGDLLTGLIASRLLDAPEDAAGLAGTTLAGTCGGVWLHNEAARLMPPWLHVAHLPDYVPQALSRATAEAAPPPASSPGAPVAR